MAWGPVSSRQQAESPVAGCAGSTGSALRVFAVACDSTTGLAGWYDAPNGERLTLRCWRTIRQGSPSRTTPLEGTEPIGPYEFCNPLQAAMLDAITGHPYGPDLDDLGPVAPAG